jgi:hypothetical protein
MVRLELVHSIRDKLKYTITQGTFAELLLERSSSSGDIVTVNLVLLLLFLSTRRVIASLALVQIPPQFTTNALFSSPLLSSLPQQHQQPQVYVLPTLSCILHFLA